MNEFEYKVYKQKENKQKENKHNVIAAANVQCSYNKNLEDLLVFFKYEGMVFGCKCIHGFMQKDTKSLEEKEKIIEREIADWKLYVMSKLFENNICSEETMYNAFDSLYGIVGETISNFKRVGCCKNVADDFTDDLDEVVEQSLKMNVSAIVIYKKIMQDYGVNYEEIQTRLENMPFKIRAIDENN